MGYLGNTPENQAFTPRVDYFSGNASATAFTLSFPVASVAQVQAVIENVPQNPGDAYTVSGNTITFTSAPPSGTNNIYVYYTSPITQVVTPGYGTVGTAQLQSSILVNPASVSDQSNTSTGYFDLPSGTTAQRPASPAVGMTRYNTTLGVVEYYNGTYWFSVTAVNNQLYSASYLVVAGGGGFGRTSDIYYSGGGGAGGLLSGTESFVPGTTYTVTVGAGGSATANGSNSVLSGSGISTLTAVGGGKGGPSNTAGSSGGSGGGGGGDDTGGSGGSGTSGQGNSGGAGQGGSGWAGGGGGGSGGAGAATVTNSGTGGTGGAGTASSITGSSVYYAAGGGGGAGFYGSGLVGTNGTGWANAANRGHGGEATTTRAGSSGVVILSVPTANYSGTTTGSPTVSTSGSNTILTFTSSGTYTA